LAIKGRHQTTGKRVYLKAAKKTFEIVAKFSNLRTAVTNQRFIQEQEQTAVGEFLLPHTSEQFVFTPAV
jgi:hypothetical protein